LRASNEDLPSVRVPRVGGRPGYLSFLIQHPAMEPNRREKH
jgi:hypothetical protein